MAARPRRYPTAQEIQRMSAQELVDRELVALPSGSYGALDTRKTRFNG